jgi:hypothetical protein
MKLSSFSENIVTVPYERSGETVNLEINIDAFTPEFFRQVAKKFEERMNSLRQVEPVSKPTEEKPSTPTDEALAFFESEALKLEIGRQIHAELLAAGILKGWDITDDDNRPIEVTYEALLTLPPLLVKDIWNLSLDHADTVKKRAESSTATSGNAQGGSAGLRVVGQGM